MSEDVKRVLIVEDDAEARASLKGFLEAAAEFDVSVADSGKDGLRACEKQNPDCVVVSNDLSDLDGLKFLDALADDAGMVHRPVIVILAKEKKMTVAKVMSAGAQDYVVRSDADQASMVRAVRHAIAIKQVTNHLEEQRNIFRAILSSTPGFLMLKNMQHQYQAVNPAFCAFVGKSLNAVVGKTDSDLFPENEAKANEKAEKAAMKSGEAESREQQLTGKKGQRWFEIARSPLKNSAGRTVGALCLAQDVTESRELKEGVEGRKEAFEALERKAGEGAKELDAAKKHIEDVQKELETARQQFEDVQKDLDGAKKQLEDAQKQVGDAQGELESAREAASAQTAAIQATEERAGQAEEQLAASQTKVAELGERFTQVAELIPCAICEVGADTKVAYLNSAGYRLFGYAEADIEGGVNLSDLFDADERSRVAVGIKESMKGKPFGPEEYRLLHKDGSEVRASVTAAPVVKEGKIGGLCIVLTDQSAEKQYVEQVSAASRIAEAAIVSGDSAQQLSHLVAAMLREPGGMALLDESTLEEVSQMAEKAGSLVEKMRAAISDRKA